MMAKWTALHDIDRENQREKEIRVRARSKWRQARPTADFWFPMYERPETIEIYYVVQPSHRWPHMTDNKNFVENEISYTIGISSLLPMRALSGNVPRAIPVMVTISAMRACVSSLWNYLHQAVVIYYIGGINDFNHGFRLSVFGFVGKGSPNGITITTNSLHLPHTVLGVDDKTW